MQLQPSTSNAQPKSSQTILHQHSRESQLFGTLRNLQLVLATTARAKSCSQLNQVLADSLILYSLYKKYHCLLSGTTFYQLYHLLGKHADQQLKLINLMSERVQILGGVAIADPRDVAKVTKIGCPSTRVEEFPAMLSRLLEAHALILSEVWEGITKTAANQDHGTSDLLVNEVLRMHELQIWFLAEHFIDTATPLDRS